MWGARMYHNLSPRFIWWMRTIIALCFLDLKICRHFYSQIL